MGRMYTAVYAGTITNAGGNTDIFEITPADDKPVILRGLILGQISEVGDAQEEGLRISIQVLPATVTAGSGGSAVTPQGLPDSVTPAAAFTVAANNTTVATTSGTASIKHEIGWNVRNTPYEPQTPFLEKEWCPKARQGQVIIVRLETTPADDLTGIFTAVLEEE